MNVFDINSEQFKLHLYPLLFLIFISQWVQAQTIISLEGEQMTQSGGFLVIKDGAFQNNGTFSATDGTVLMSGTANDVDATVGGSSTTLFNNLQISKTSNNVLLTNNIQVSNTLNLSNGLLDIGDYNVSINSGGSSINGSTNSYIKTSGTGVLTQEVNNSDKLFPVGYDRYTPATLNNSGTPDSYSIRTIPIVYFEGTTGTVVSTDVVDVTWFIDEGTPGGSDIDLTLQWNELDELNNFDRTNSFISSFDGIEWTQLTIQSISSSEPYSIIESSISSITPFTVSSNIGALPVELLYFYGEKMGNKVLLNWETESERNNDYFEVEWSIDAKSFQPIGRVKGMGTTSSRHEYELIHSNPAFGLNYYRLKQVDFDGQFEYSNLVAVRFDSKEKDLLNLYPNPNSNNLLYIDTNQAGDIQIFNTLGQLLISTPQPNGGQINISALSAGTYFVKVGHLMKKLIVR